MLLFLGADPRFLGGGGAKIFGDNFRWGGFWQEGDHEPNLEQAL